MKKSEKNSYALFALSRKINQLFAFLHALFS